MKLPSLILCLLISMSSIGQLKVDKGMNKEALRKFFSNAGIEVKGIKYKGHNRAIGQFTQADSIFDMSHGIILSTGDERDIPSNNLSGSRSTKNGTKGHELLTALCGAETMDAASIEVQFIPSSDYISFNFVFGSDEYPEYVRSKFNDVFAFYLTTPKKKKYNIAVIPKTRTRIAINSVNQYRQSHYFVNNYYLPFPISAERNDTVKYVENGVLYYSVTSYKIASAVKQFPKIPVEFDGYTKLIQAKAKVVPGKLHTLEICIADASDKIYDSGVLLEAGSFQSHDNPDFSYGKLADNQYYFNHDTIQAQPFEQEIFEASLTSEVYDSLFGGFKNIQVANGIVEKPKSLDSTVVKLTANIPSIDSTPSDSAVPLKKWKDIQFIAHYPTDIFNIQVRDRNELQKIAHEFNPDFNYEVHVVAYTDQDASARYNQKLSERRAAGIVAYISTNFPSNVIVKQVSGKGIHSNSTL
ncbi:MAG: choice-of-anchor L domain-containing protein, partial [Flavobacteriales bacterium]|nr:choice-of-anchor L domain-containing protein [Flavobacteriales bacterium]